jgi:hypothetical protein
MNRPAVLSVVFVASVMALPALVAYANYHVLGTPKRPGDIGWLPAWCGFTVPGLLVALPVDCILTDARVSERTQLGIYAAFLTVLLLLEQAVLLLGNPAR